MRYSSLLIHPLAVSASRLPPRILLALWSMTVALLLFGCATGRTAFKQGDYVEAVRLSAERLSGQPKNAKAREVFLVAYPQARREWLARAQSAVADRSDPFRYERALEAYQVLRDLANRAALTPFSEADGIAIEYFPEEIEAARMAAAKARVERGDALLLDGGLISARRAYDHYDVAQRYTGMREDIFAKMEEARLAGTLRLGVDPVVSNGHGINPRELDSVIVSRLARNPVHFFVATGPVEGFDDGQVDHFLEVTVGEMSITRSEGEQSQRQVRRSIPSKREGDEPIEARATVFTRKKQMIARCPVTVRVFDRAADGWTLERPIDAQTVWTAHWELVQGDRRALGNEELNLVEPPDPELGQMAQELAYQVAQDVHAVLVEYYR